MGIHQGIDTVQEGDDFAVILQEFDHLGVGSVELAVILVFAGIVDAATVENITAAIAAGGRRNSFFEGETVDLDLQPVVVLHEVEFRFHGEFFQNPVQIGILAERGLE